MGGNQSAPRKISIPNDENQSHFIKVSDSVAERLKKCAEKHPIQEIKNPEDCPPKEIDQTVRNLENIPPYKRGRKYWFSNNIGDVGTKIKKKTLTPAFTVPGDPVLNYYYGPSLTSIRVLQEKENELKASEEYWSRRIQNMEDHHSKLSKIMEEEYNKAVKEISCQVPRPPPNTPFPCSGEKDRVLNCYKRNPKEILLCAGEVMEFSDCVHAKRLYPENRENCEN